MKIKNCSRQKDGGQACKINHSLLNKIVVLGGRVICHAVMQLKKVIQMKTEIIFKIIVLTLLGTLGSILVGFLFVGNLIFVSSHSAFQFITMGFAGSLFFSLLEFTSKKEQLFGIAIIIILDITFILGKYISFSSIIRDLFYLLSLLLSIKLYQQFIRQNSKLTLYLRSFALAIFYAINNIIAAIIVYTINAKLEFPPIDFLIAMGKIGLLVGFGIGIGYDYFKQIINYLIKMLKLKTA
ncbi:MAG: hypothetical protein IPM32_02300 [Ignavibacteriae bacterium]|nr:hypothetical protein [Ignavibacteriota bacterium]